MKKSITACILILLLLIVLLTVCACVPQDVCTIQYTAGEGGTVIGDTKQKIVCGNDGDAVTAVPNKGYEFLKWSDDVTTAERQDKSVQKDITVTALFKKVDAASKSYTITYLVEEGGTLEGEAVQTIREDDGGTKSVSVIVKDGYEFLGWSDGHNELWRSDSYFNIDYYYKQDTTFTAKIRRIDDYKLMDWYTEFGVGVPTIEITENTYDNLSFPIPTREHFTFEGWYFGDTLIADTQGKSYFTKEMLEDGSRSITAKWTPNETFTYKILLVYVTRIDAVLPTVDQTSKIHVDYTISDLEREFYHWTTIRLKEYMDEMMFGLVDFQINEYYTTQTILTQDFVQAGGVGGISNSLLVDRLSETKEMIKNYDSALIVFGLNDDSYKLHNEWGSASVRYGEVYADYFMSRNDFDKDIEAIKNDNFNWLDDILLNNTWLDTFVHEIAHTIETRINGYSYHNCIYNGMNSLVNQYKQRMYYLNEIEKDGKKVGIPYEFWAGDIMNVCYEPMEGCGRIDGQGFFSNETPEAAQRIYEVLYGYNVPTVTAVPLLGYEFVEWSDGVKTATRTDTNITENKVVTAIFAPITYKLTIVADEGGIVLEGDGTFEVKVGDQCLLKAKANEGYKFVGWSDGDKAIWRPFRINTDTVELFDENRQYTLVAMFEKIEK